MDKTVGVRISKHAVDRFHERFPNHPYDQIKRTIFREVHQALDAGRRSSRLPEWAERVMYPSGRHRPERFVYNTERTRCYPIVEDRGGERGDEFGIQWRVKTTLAAMTEEQLAHERRLRSLARANNGSRNGTRRRGHNMLGGKRR